MCSPPSVRSQLTQQVFEGCHGMIENHPWSDPSHDVFDLCLHVRTIAMHGALFASRFVLSESASVQATVGIIQQSLTLRAERMIPFLLATVDSNHLLDHLLFFFRAQFFCHDVLGIPTLPKSSRGRRDKSSGVSFLRRCKCFLP